MDSRSKDVVMEIRRIDEEQAAEEARNPLAGYSTRQLKAELARRGRQSKDFSFQRLIERKKIGC